MNYPRQIYAIYPLDENGNVAGVYIGSSQNVKKRIKSHALKKSNAKYCDSQAELHHLMRTNGYSFEILDSIENSSEDYKEFKWVETLSKKCSRLFNKYLGNEYQGKENEIGNQMYQYLVRNNIHLYELAKETQIKPLRLSKIFKNYAKVNCIEYYKICKALGVPLEFFLKGVEI